MTKNAQRKLQSQESLSRERIVKASIKLLDRNGEAGLTFRALCAALRTGAGAIYWHITDKGDLLTAACEAVVADALAACTPGPTPEATIRALALAMFDAMDEHAWLGSALSSPAGQLPIVRILEPLGQQVCALGVADEALWATVSALVSYVLGVGGQNAANGAFARAHRLKRAAVLDAVARRWSQLDAQQYPFTRSIADRLRSHDDRSDFVTGIDLILRGVERRREAL